MKGQKLQTKDPWSFCHFMCSRGMQISAKFQTVCPTCHHRIAVGERIEWGRGKSAVHVKCPSSQQDLPETKRKKRAPAPEIRDDYDVRYTAGFYDFDSGSTFNGGFDR